MIEYKPKNLQGDDWRSGMVWVEISPHWTVDHISFEYNMYRIQGKIFKHKTKVFAKAFNTERLWEKLQQ